MYIPYALVDTGSNTSIITENIVKKLGLEIDTKSIPEIIGVGSSADTIGTVHDLPVTISSLDKNDSITITDDFAVVKEDKNHLLVLLGTPWLHRAGWEPVVNGEFKICCEGKKINIPLSVHKLQRFTFIANKTVKKSSLCKTIRDL